MKIRTFQLLAKEGSRNIYKNKLMSFASIMTVVATLFFLGIILLIAVNITSNVEAMKRDLNVSVFLYPDASEFQREEVISFIEQEKAAGVVSEYRIEPKEQMYQNLKDSLKNEGLLKGFSAENAAESYYIKLINPSYSEAFISKLLEFSGVNKDGVAYNKEGLEKLEGVLKVFNYITIALLTVLMIISVFLISNTIRLTVFARRREIEIMKYVGALDNFIRWPFIVEGILIGFLGALFSFFLTSQAYTWLQNVINVILSNLRFSTLQILAFGPVSLRILMIYSIFGIIIGGIGSLLSVRKHLNV